MASDVKARPSRDELESLLDAAGVMVQVVAAADGRFAYVNRAWKATLGYDDADAARLTVFDVVAPAAAEEMRERMARAGDGDAAWEIATELTARDGRRLLVAGSASVARDGDGAVSARAAFRDVSPRREIEVEVELRQSRARLLALIENTDDAIWSVDRAYRLVTFNSDFRTTYEHNFGIPVVDGMNLVDVATGAPRAYWKGVYDRALGGERFSVEFRGTAARGGQLLLCAFNPIVENDAVTGVVVISRDLSERERAQTRMRESEARLRGLVQHALDAVITVDARGAIEAFNPAAEKIFAVAAHEVFGRSIDAVLPGEAPGVEGAPLVPGRRETLGLRGDGTRVPIELTVSEVPLADRRVYMVLARDVTERKEVERLKSEFVAVVSHELRTPLTSIRGSLGLLEGGVVGELPGPARELVSIARSNTDRLIRLINEILDLEKLEAGKIDLRVAVLDASELVGATLDGLRPLADEARITLGARVAPLPALVGDRDRLIQVLTNFVSNAIKFSPPASAIVVTVERAPWGGVRFAVTDHGPGIAAEHMPRLFGRFEQLEASDHRPRGGTGLGLAISKAIVEQHGGRVGVESRVGVGSTFWFELANAPTVPPPRRASGTDAPLILLVEDDDDLAAAIGPLLVTEGYDFARAATIAEADRLLAASTPALVLMDVGLPDGNGLDFTKRIHARAATAQVPVIVLSGRERVRGAFADPRVLDWLAKPFDDARLLRAVRHAVRRGGAPRVLVVDDDAATRAVLVAQLKGLGVEPIEAVGGAEALDIARATPVDLIVLDIAMPAPDGFAVVATLRGEGRTPALLVYSARDLSSGDRAALTLGPSTHLTKSRTTETELLAAVRSLLDPPR